MNSGSYVFKQITSYFPKYEFDKLVSKYKGHYNVQKFSCWAQFLCLCFGQITQRESLRDIVLCLQSHSSKLYHLGIRKGVAKSTLADANEVRNWRIYAEFSQLLISQVWTAVAVYVLIAIIKKKLNLEHSIYEILQILSISVFDKMPLNQLLMNQHLQKTS
jgi:hypothetical protein